MKKTAITLFLVSVSSPALAEEVTLKPIIEARLRYENVDQTGVLNEADAITLRVRAGVEAKTGAFALLAETEATLAISEHYNSGLNGLAAYPIVADPQNVELNRLQLQFSGLPKTVVTVGRQRINLDDQRFVGSVGWRQNDQTLDAVRAAARPAKSLSIDYLYAWRVNRVFGPDAAQGIWRDTDIHGARVAHQSPVLGSLSAYGYWLDIPASPASSSMTLGVRLSGERPLAGKTRFTYAAELAHQQDHGNNPRRFNLDYLLLEPGIARGPFALKAGFERLEGDGVVGLQTPLATLHAFNGWADKFLSTPANGLRDLYLDASAKATGGPLKGAALRVVWHDFNATRGGIDYGTEFDAQLAYPVRKNVTLLAKFARYDADAFATDTTKAWFQVEAKF